MESNSIPNNFSVHGIGYDECKGWCLNKHYAHRMPPISFSFGLFNKENELVGICTYGRPMAHPLIKNAFGGKFQDCFYELNRLCVNDGLPRNTLSFFVAQTLNMLPKTNGYSKLRRHKLPPSWLYIPSNKLALYGLVSAI